MSKRASPTAIGAFVVGGLALLVAGVLLFGGGQLFKRPLKYALFFDTSVEGLSVGAPVQWRGVKVGQVARIEGGWGTDWIEVVFDLNPRTLRGGKDLSAEEVEENLSTAIKEGGLRAQLRTQSLLTGQLFVALDRFPGSQVKLAGLDPSLPEIPVVPTSLQVFRDRVEKFLDALTALPLPQLVESTTSALDAINKVVSSKELHQTIERARAGLEEIRSFTHMLNEKGESVLASTKETVDITRNAVAEVSQNTRKLLVQLDVDAQTLNTLLQETQRVVQKTGGEIESAGSSVRGTLEDARAALAKTQGTLGALDDTVGGGTPLGYQLLNTLQDLAAASRAVRTLAEYLDQHPEALLKGKGNSGGK